MVEETGRLYTCQRCGKQTCICRLCDRGQIYCPGECRKIRRLESLRRAGAIYRRTLEAKRKRSARRRGYRLAKLAAKLSAHKGTHHGSTQAASEAMPSSCVAAPMSLESPPSSGVNRTCGSS